jgi:magnesium and cobalt transporter
MNDGPSSPSQIAEAGRSNPGSVGWWRRLTRHMSASPRSREDLMGLLQAARADGLIEADAADMIHGVFSVRELSVRDIMVPRAQMVVVERATPLEQLLDEVAESGHSRYPVIGDSRDEIVGVLLAKDLLKFRSTPTGTDSADFDLARVLRPAAFVPESKRVNVLLKDFRKSRNHMAIVADEYGGVAGLVTIEDVLEQIVGEIDDEHDDAEGAQIVKQDERRYLVNALTPVEDFNQYFGSGYSNDEYDTIGGLVLHAFGRMPRRGESIDIERYQFNVQRADGRRVHLLQVTLPQP